MADETFAIAIAVGVQTAFGTKNATIAGLTGTIDETDGCVLGDKASGNADSGIGIPQIVPIVREVDNVALSFSEKAAAFQRAQVNALSISIPMQGNGELAGAPDAGAADLFATLPGVEAIYESCGLIGADGTSPVEEYTPRIAATSPPQRYVTIKVWIGPHSFVYVDCIAETADMVWTPGGSGILTGNYKVGSHDPTVDFATDLTFPTVTYGTQASLFAPTVEGVNFTWGPTRGFESLKLSVAQAIVEFGDSNVLTTGKRLAQTGRIFTLDGVLYSDDSDPDFEYQKTIGASAPTEDLSFQVGEVAGSSPDICNGYLVECNNIQSYGFKPDKRGDAMVVEISSARCTAPDGSPGGEFKLTQN